MTDSFFNHRAAKKAEELIMKMDEDEARVFITMVVGDHVTELIEKNHRSVQSHLNDVVTKRMKQFQRGLGSAAVSKRLDDTEALATAGAYTLISKAIGNPGGLNPAWQESDVRRTSDGRFTFKVKRNTGQGRLNRKTQEALDIPTPKEKKWQLMDKTRQQEYQHQYTQLVQILDNFSNSDDIRLIVQNTDRKDPSYKTQQQRAVQATNGKGLTSAWNPAKETVIGVTVSPKNLQVGGATFDLMTALGTDPRTAAIRGQQVAALPGGMKTFNEEWADAGDSYMRSGNQRTYDQIAAGSKLVGTVAPVGSKAQMAATFGGYVGSMGPEAEKVIGPGARKAAYRYRGVSKDPEREIARTYDQYLSQGPAGRSEELSTTINARSTRALEAAVQAKAKKNNTDPSNITLSTNERTAILNRVKLAALKEAGPDDLTRSLARVNIANKLEEHQWRKGKKPSHERYGLQLASGHVPPSEGIIINRDGKVTRQAVGYADDHYLPFNLKQLGDLRGGEYVRTRSVGGPTAEDIYAGYLSGAKALTVTSRSGTFVIEFEDDFRGKRRYNDKAKRMTDRYEKLLDAVQSEKVDRPVDTPKIFQQLARKEAEESGFGDRKLKNEIYRARLEELKEQGLDPEKRDEILDAVEDAFADQEPPEPGTSWRQVAAKDLDELMETKFQLNGRGYSDAMKSLQEQFPYYIKQATWIPRDKEFRGANSKDRGYVKPRFNRPAEAKAGYFDASIAGENTQASGKYAGTGKYGADEADYQNHKHVGAKKQTEEVKEVTSTPVTPEKTDDSPAPVSTGVGFTANPAATTAASGGASYADKVEIARASGNIWEYLVGLYGADQNFGPKYKDVIGTRDQLEADIKSRGIASPKFDALKAAVVEAKSDRRFDPSNEAVRTFDMAQKTSGRLSFNESTPFALYPAPFKFKDVAGTKVITDLDKIQDRTNAKSVNGRISNPGGGSEPAEYAKMDDDELKDEIRMLDDFNEIHGPAAKEMWENKDMQGALAYLAEKDYHTEAPLILNYLRGQDKVKLQAEMAQKQRAINLERELFSAGKKHKNVSSKQLTATPKPPSGGGPSGTTSHLRVV